MHDFEQYGITGINPRRGGDQKTTCPKCSTGRRKSGETCLSVNVGDGIWNCHHCGRGGSLKTGWNDEAKPYRAHRPDYEKNSWQRAYSPRPVSVQLDSVPDGVVNHFQKRGISREVVEKHKIGVEVRSIEKNAPKRVCVAFPYIVDGQTVNVKYRARDSEGDKRFVQIGGADKVFYNLDGIRDTENAIVVEGEMDCLSFEEVGLSWAVSVPDGGINENVQNLRSKLEYLDNCERWFESKKRIYLATDTDGPGLRLRDELARRFGKDRCWIVRFPDDCKDANEVLVKHGADTLRKCVDDAEPFPVAGIYDLGSCEDELNDLYEYGHPEGATIGFFHYDQHFKYYPGQLTVVTGIPGHGKTTWCDFVKVRLSKLSGWRHGLFSPENNPPEVLMERLCCMYAGKPLTPNYQNRMSYEEFLSAKAFVRDHFYLVNPDDGRFTVDAVLDLAKTLVRRRGIAQFEIDPWNNLEHAYARGESETAYIGRTLNRFKFFAREHGLHFTLIAHPTKMDRIGNSQNYKPPTLYSISGSANFYNITDNGYTVYRMKNPDGGEDTYLFVEKIKNRYHGKTGRVRLSFDESTYQYSEDIVRQHEPPDLTGDTGYTGYTGYTGDDDAPPF